MTAILIDDERPALRALRGMLEQFCQRVSILAEATSVPEAVGLVQLHRPDLVFLDIEMPPLHKGFDLLKAVPELHFGVIFTTAHPHYALQAINEAQPWGYLVKPIRVKDLQQAVGIAEAKIAEQQGSDSKSLIVPDLRKGNLVLRVANILYCKADGSTTDIYHLHNGKVERAIASRPLREIEDALPEADFYRTHRSYIVNLHHVVRYQRTGRNGVVFLAHGCKAEVSVMGWAGFEQRVRDLEV
jgi:two-component system LytT family response regulator